MACSQRAIFQGVSTSTTCQVCGPKNPTYLQWATWYFKAMDILILIRENVWEETKLAMSRLAETKDFSVDSFSPGLEKAIGCYDAPVQELIVIDDLLSALVGIGGRYISIKRVHGNDDDVTFQVDASMDLALQELVKQIFPLCKSFLLVHQFVESRSQFKNGLVNHAFAAALRALLLAKAMAGDNAVRLSLEKMTQCASSAYLGILERWVYEGVIDDPYGDFFVAENKSLQKESLTQDHDAEYWGQRYSLKDGIPSFLASAAGTILTTGKYLNVMRECGHNVQVPVSENSKLMSFSTNHHYLECTKAAYDFASGELLNLIKNKYDLVGKLRSIRHYFLLDQERASLLKKLSTLKDLDISRTVSDSNDLEEPVSLNGFKTFSLSYKLIVIDMLLNVGLCFRFNVISRKSLTKYQLIFHFLFHCKHVNRQLCGAWQVHQVLEPNWHVMHNRLQTAKSIDEVIQFHDFFLEKCLRECLLLLPELLKKVEKLKSLCLQYAAATQWLISSSTVIPKPEAPSDGSRGFEKFKQGKLRDPSQPLKLITGNASGYVVE
ncbi:hypothetical protein L1049_004762 [Liquidambar formosana]|uniref:Gamma-tubulin complex component n=1 Tax=Liquidambar formosana TaxID=63359 RepID=A0AAP0RP08_LIQFO